MQHELVSDEADAAITMKDRVSHLAHRCSPSLLQYTPAPRSHRRVSTFRSAAARALAEGFAGLLVELAVAEVTALGYRAGLDRRPHGAAGLVQVGARREPASP